MSGMSSSAACIKQNFFFGWDLLYNTVEGILSRKTDVILLLAHFVLIKHAKFQCIGVGEDKTISPDDRGSEILPYGWNADDNKYALRYTHGNHLYLLLAHKTGNSIIMNLLDTESKKVSNIVLDPEIVVKRVKGSLNEQMPEASQIANRILKELIEPVFAGTTREITTQTVCTLHAPPQRRHVDPLRLNDHRLPLAPHGSDPLNPYSWPEVGRGDLDPLARGGPGNLLPFPSAPDFHNEVRPRFDPYGTPSPDSNNPPSPNPDHLRPPTFNNHDYYM